MSDLESIFKVNLDDKIRDLFIINNSATRKKNIFVVPWGAALVRNCSANGQLLDFSTVKGYENQVKDDG